MEAVVNNETGFLVEEHDIEGMAERMIKIAGEVKLAVDLGLKEATYIRANYNTNDRINTLAAILKNAIKENINVEKYNT